MKKLIQELQDLAISLAAEHIELGNEIKTHKNRIDIYMEQNNLSGDIGDSKTIRKLQQDHSNFFEKISSDLHQTRLKEIYAAAKLQLLVEHVIPLIEKYNAE